MGIASLVLGIISIIIGFVPFCGSIAFLPALVGLILGIVDIVKKSKGKEKKGMAIAGTIMCAIAIVVIFFWILIVAISGGQTSSNNTVSFTNDGEKSTVTSEVIENNTDKEEENTNNLSEENYKNSCESIEYKEISRNPDNYKNKKVKFTGKVVQVMEGGILNSNSVTFRIDVTQGSYGIWDDTVYCTYKYKNNENKILEDDIVDFYGECKGTTTYTTILGAQITIPKVEIKYIELSENNSGSKNKKYNVGETYKGNGLIIEYISLDEDFTDYKRYATVSDGCQIIKAEFEFENTGASSQYVSSYYFKCFADGYDCKNFYSVDDSGFSADLSNGRKTKGSVYFEVPSDAEEITLEYSGIGVTNNIEFTVK